MKWLWRRAKVGAAHRNVVYTWPTVKGYYAERAVPDRTDLRAKPGDRASKIVGRLPADVGSFLFHIDLTDTSNYPLERTQLVDALRSRGIRVLNAGVTNISKRTVHALTERLTLPCALAKREGDGSELVIVKTDRNYGGRSERWLPGRQRRRLGFSEGSSVIRAAFDYRVMPRVEVPLTWWDDPNLVIERFIASPDQRLHRVHIVVDHFAFWSGASSLHIKKIADCHDTREYFLRRGELHPALPGGLLRPVYDFVQSFGLDYGALDLVGDDLGRYYVIDANSTPWRSTESQERMEFLRAAWERP